MPGQDGSSNHPRRWLLSNSDLVNGYNLPAMRLCILKIHADLNREILMPESSADLLADGEWAGWETHWGAADCRRFWSWSNCQDLSHPSYGLAGWETRPTNAAHVPAGHLFDTFDTRNLWNLSESPGFLCVFCANLCKSPRNLWEIGFESPRTVTSYIPVTSRTLAWGYCNKLSNSTVILRELKCLAGRQMIADRPLVWSDGKVSESQDSGAFRYCQLLRGNFGAIHHNSFRGTRCLGKGIR